MKGIVADLVVGTHGENGLPGRLECSTIDFAVCGARDIACVNSIRSFVCKTCRELLPDDLCDRGSVTREARKARAQRAFTSWQARPLRLPSSRQSVSFFLSSSKASSSRPQSLRLNSNKGTKCEIGFYLRPFRPGPLFLRNDRLLGKLARPAKAKRGNFGI